MNSLVLIFFSFINAFSPPYPTDQLPDFLVMDNDTILLKSFPLEELSFEIRPFSYNGYSYPDIECIRGYQAVWKVVGRKLFLAEILKADESRERIDIVPYFMENDYTPNVINGLIFADWFTMDLTPFPRDIKFLGCVWKDKTPKKQKASIRFRHGVMTANHYNSKHHR